MKKISSFTIIFCIFIGIAGFLPTNLVFAQSSACGPGHTNNGNGTCTATFGDPAVDGITYRNSMDTLSNWIAFGRNGEIRGRGFVEWNITSIPSYTTVLNVNFIYHGSADASNDSSIVSLTANRPQTVNPSNPIALYNEIADQSAYIDPWNPSIGDGQRINLGSQAVADFETQLTRGWFALGFLNDETDNLQIDTFYSENYSSANPSPTLEILYTALPDAGRSPNDDNCPEGHIDNGDGSCEANFTSDYDGITYENTMDNLSDWIAFGRNGENRGRGYSEWNISSIPSDATITSVAFIYHGTQDGSNDSSIMHIISNRPSTVDPEDPSSLYNEIANADIYFSGWNPVLGPNQILNLGQPGIVDVQSALTNGWFALGFLNEETINLEIDMLYAREAGAASPVPTLQVMYELHQADNGGGDNDGNDSNNDPNQEGVVLGAATDTLPETGLLTENSTFNISQGIFFLLFGLIQVFLLRSLDRHLKKGKLDISEKNS